MIFKSQKEFDQTVNLVSRLNDDEKAHLFESVYNKGFIPLTPYLSSSSSNASFIADYFKEKKKYTPDNFDLEEYSLEDPLIPSNNLSSLLNIKREVIINHKIHAFTYAGLVMTGEENTKAMYDFIKAVDGYKTLRSPDEAYSKKSLSKNFNDIEVWVNPDALSKNLNNSKSCYDEPVAYLSNSREVIDYNQPLIYETEDCNSGDYSGSGSTYSGSTYSGSTSSDNSTYDSTQSMIDFMNEQDACDYQFGSGIFGNVNILCFDYFDGGVRRTRTKYYDNNFFIWRELGVKVKHQRKRSYWLGSYWDRNKTDEIAVIINQASYVKSSPNTIADFGIHEFDFPSNSSKGPVYWVGEYAYNAPNNILTVPTVMKGSDFVPETPFNDDIIIHLIDNGLSTNYGLGNIDWDGEIEITAKKLNKLFYEQIYDNAKGVYKSITGKEAKKYSLVITTPEKMCVHHVNLSKRRLNENVVNEVFENDFGATVGLQIGVEGPSLKVVDDVAKFSLDTTFKFDFGFSRLDEYEDIFIDFYGLSRRGDEWRGSRLIYSNK